MFLCDVVLFEETVRFYDSCHNLCRPLLSQMVLLIYKPFWKIIKEHSKAVALRFRKKDTS